MTTPRFLFCSVALAAFVTCLPVSVAQAQYIGYRSDQPTVEIDLSALDGTETTSPVQPRQQPRTENFPPPITSGNATGNQPPAIPVPRVENAPKRLVKPLFAVPVNTPAPQPPPVTAPKPTAVQQPPTQNIIWQQPAAQKPVPKAPAARTQPQTPAVRQPYNPYLSTPTVTPPSAAPQTATQQPGFDAALQPDARQKMPLPVMVNTPLDVDSLAALPRRKPETVATPEPVTAQQTAPSPVTAKSPPVKATPRAQPEAVQAQAPAANTHTTMSYPPSRSQKAPVQYYDRPVLPTVAPDTTTLSAQPVLPSTPVALPEERITLEADTPVIQPVRKPVVATPATLPQDTEAETFVPARKPVQTQALDTLMQDEVAPPPENNIATVQSPVDAPANILPAARPSLVTTSAPPPEMRQDAEPQAIFGYPAEAEQTPVPFEQIAENMKTVPVEVAIAPPKPEYGARAVPSKADLTLEFKGHSEELDTQSQSKLLNIVKLLDEDSNRKLLVRGYASGENGSKTDALDKSLSRVSEVRSFLMEQGVRPTRVMVRALGQETDRKPLDRVDLVFAQQ